MIHYKMGGLTPDLWVLAAGLESMAKEYADKAEKNSERPPSPINTPMASEHRHGHFQGKSEAYGYAARELANLLKWYGVPEPTSDSES
jgi:hypothetical protein